MPDYDTTLSLSEIRKRLNAIESRLAKLEPTKPKPNPTIPSLEKTRKPSPQERAKEREILQAQARRIEEEQREERLAEREKYGLHGIAPAKNPTTPRRSLEQRRADARVGKVHIDDISTTADRAIADHKADRKK